MVLSAGSRGMDDKKDAWPLRGGLADALAERIIMPGLAGAACQCWRTARGAVALNSS